MVGTQEQSWTSVFQGILFLGFIVGSLAFLGWLSWRGLTSLESNLSRAVIGGTIGITGTLIAGILAHYQTKKRQVAQELRSQKAPIYAEFMDFVVEMMAGNKGADEGERFDKEEMEEFMIKWMPKMMVWGSPAMIQQWNQIRTLGAEAGEGGPDNPMEMVLAFERLMAVMRADLGHDDSRLEEGEIMRTMITDM